MIVRLVDLLEVQSPRTRHRSTADSIFAVAVTAVGVLYGRARRDRFLVDDVDLVGGCSQTGVDDVDQEGRKS